jgi:hypothetical protein
MALRPHRSVRTILICIALCLMILVASACGRSQQNELAPTDEPTALAAATDTPPTATAAPATGDELTATVELTTTAPMTTPLTETEEVTGAKVLTETPTLVSAEDLTATASLTATEGMTGAEVLTETPTLVAAEDLTVTAQVTDTEEVAATDVTTEALEEGVFFVQPTDRALVPLSTTVVVSVTEVVTDPTGAGGAVPGTLYLLIDTNFVAAGEPIPEDEQHLAVSDGEVTDDVTDDTVAFPLQLTPGEHVLRLQLANSAGEALTGDAYRDEIVVTAQEGAPAQSVRFVEPQDGAVVPPAFRVVASATGVIIQPAGYVHPDAGHLNILVDTDFIPAGDVIPVDPNHINLGEGQLETTLQLSPGQHVLRLQMADGAHIALPGDEFRDEIMVTVE